MFIASISSSFEYNYTIDLGYNPKKSCAFYIASASKEYSKWAFKYKIRHTKTRPRINPNPIRTKQHKRGQTCRNYMQWPSCRYDANKRSNFQLCFVKGYPWWRSCAHCTTIRHQSDNNTKRFQARVRNQLWVSVQWVLRPAF